MKKLIYLLVICFSFLLNNAKSQIDFTLQPSKVHSPSYFGMNGSNVWTDPSGYNIVDNKLNQFKIKHVRHIGGSYGMFFNWQTGYPLTDKELLYGYNLDPNDAPVLGLVPNTIDLFKSVIASEGADMIFDLNVLTTKFNFQRAAIMYALSKNQKLRGVELGNELYLEGLRGKRQFAFSFPTAQIYADSVNGWSKTLHNTFGSIHTPKIAVVGADQTTDNENNVGEDDRINTWMPIVLDKVNWLGADGPDAISIHRYTGSNYDLKSMVGKLTINPDDMNPYNGQAVIFMRKTLNRPHLNFTKLQTGELTQISAENTNLKAWITEYGMFDRSHEVHGTWAHGLFTALQTLKYLESDIVELVDIHSMVGDATFACIFTDSKGFDLPGSFNDNVDEANDTDPNNDNLGEEIAPNVPEVENLDGQATYTTIPGEKTAVGNALSLIGKAMQDAISREKMVLPNSTVIINYGAENGGPLPYEWLYGWKFTQCAGRKSYIILNNSIDEVEINASNFGTSATYTSYSANPREYIRGNATACNNANILPNLDDFNNGSDGSAAHTPYDLTGTLNGSGTLKIKPYSITYVLGPQPALLCAKYLTLCDEAAGTTGIVMQDEKFTIKVSNGVGPYKWTSNVASSAAGLLNTNTAVDNIELTAYKTAGATPYVIQYTVEDLGRPGITDVVTITVKAKKTVSILLGSTTTSPAAGTTVNTCNNACVTLTASNIDNTPADNRYEWYSSDGNQSITSTTGYAKNGYAQTVTICPTQATQKYYVIAYTGTCPEYARSEIIVESIIANANNPLNDEASMYMCNTPQAIPTRVGFPDPIPSPGYTYQWTAADGGVISPTPPGNATTPQPIITQAGTYNLVVSRGGCSRTSQVKVLAYPCCTTAVNSLKFPPYTKMSTVVNTIQNDIVNCIGCVTNDGALVTNYDQIINFNGPVVMDIVDKSVTFANCDNLFFAADAKLSVRDGKTLTISNSNLDACTNQTWRGLTSQTAQEEVIIKGNSNIKNALIGLDSRNNSLVNILNSNFDKNKYHLKFTGYGGNVGSELNFIADDPLDPLDVAGYVTTYGIAANNFKNTGTMLSNVTPNDRTTNGIWFENCLGSIKIGGVPVSEAHNNIDEANTFNKAIYSIYANGSGLNVENNIFTNFEQGIRSLNSKENQVYLINNNTLNSTYFYSTTNAELNNKGTAIYLAATASITPEKMEIKSNTITQSRQGIFITKFNPKYSLLGDVLENHAAGCEVLSNIITLTSQSGFDFLHKAIVLIENQHLDVVDNTLSTNLTSFNALTPVTKKDKYFGIEMNTLTNGSDIFDNSFTTLGKMISVINGNPATQFRCNFFDKGLSTNNYQGDGVIPK